jgi:hypothetical protein
MKMRFCHLLVLFAFSAGLLPGLVQAQFDFTTNSGAITITYYTGSGGAVVIPATINGYPVINIGTGAFDVANVTSVTISTNVINIENDAFYNCTSLANVSIPNSVTGIGGLAFAGCTSLTNVTIPYTVGSIGDYAFGGCTSLTSAVFQGNEPPNDGTIFSDDNGNTTVYYLSGTTGWGSTFGGVPTAVLTSQSQFNYTANNGVITVTGYTGSNSTVVIPDTMFGLPIGSIGSGTFDGNTSLTAVTSGTNLTSIGTYAFTFCTSMTAVTIGTNVTSIGEWAFAHCYDLPSVIIPKSVTYIGDDAFFEDLSLTAAYFQGNAPPDDGTIFAIDSDITTVYYLPGTTGWGSTFGGVPTSDIMPGSLQVTINPAGAVTAGAQWQVDGGPAQSSGMTVSNLSIGTHTVSFTTVSGWATPTNETLSISNNSTTTANEVYLQTSPYTCAINSDNTLSIVGYTGVGGTVTIPATIDGLLVTSIGNGGFMDNDAVTNIIMSNSVTSIGQAAFWECYGLTSVTIDTNVTSIGGQAFEYCYDLTSVTIPASVTSIGDYAFGYDYLTSAYFQGNAPPDDGTIFQYDSGTPIVYYQAGTTGWSSTFGSLPTQEIAPNGNLQLTINPAGAVSAGAQWQVDGGAAQNSGATFAHLSVGNHTVSFTTVGGWATPTNETITISDNLTSTASGAYIQSSPFTCAINNNTLTIVGYIGAGGAVTIPAAICGLPVTSIGSNAFSSQTTITSVTIPNSVTSLGESAFMYCYDLTNVILSTNLTSIEDNTFFECYDLLKITIPASVVSIGQLAFYDCTSLTGMYFQGNAPAPAALGFDPFDLDSNLTVYYLPGTTGWGSAFGGVPAVLLPPVGPTLSITLVSIPGTTTSSAVVSWPSPSMGFVLQQNSNPSTTNWTNSGFPINDNGTTRWVTNSPATGSLFFRLNNP